MKYDCLIIGAGLSGLTAAALLAKRGLAVAVCEQASSPGGSCGVFKRQIDGNPVFFDQGSSMFFGFGNEGINTHRLLFNFLEEPFYVLKHSKTLVMDHDGHRIEFTGYNETLPEQLAVIFPRQRSNIESFYRDLHEIYNKAIHKNLKLPIAHIKQLSYINMSTEQLLKKHIDDSNLLDFFNKFIYIYCHSSLSETPAVIAASVLIGDICGGSWYPAGSTQFFPGILEKVIEENGGKMYYDSYVKRINFNSSKPTGILLSNDTAIPAKNIIYSGNIWDLYGKLIPKNLVRDKILRRVFSQECTYPCLVLYSLVEKSVIPNDCCSIEILASDPGVTDEGNIKVFVPSLDDHTLCDEAHHIIIAIGPSFINWGIDIDFSEFDGTPDERYANTYSDDYYDIQKENEASRIISLLEKRFHGISEHLIYYEMASPFTIQRYTMKYSGATAGPKFKSKKYIMRRPSIKTRWPGLYCCGEATTIGPGTSAVTCSGITAANAVLKRYGISTYKQHKKVKEYVVELDKPVTKDRLYANHSIQKAKIMEAASKCMFCESPACCNKNILDIPGIMRRASCGNMIGAYKAFTDSSMPITYVISEKCPFGALPSETIQMILDFNINTSIEHPCHISQVSCECDPKNIRDL